MSSNQQQRHVHTTESTYRTFVSLGSNNAPDMEDEQTFPVNIAVAGVMPIDVDLPAYPLTFGRKSG